MIKKYKFNMDQDVYEKFATAASLMDHDISEAMEICMKHYISESFARSKEYETKLSAKNHEKESYERGKANRKIPLWAYKPEQYNHKIVRAFFEVEKTTGHVSLHNLERACSDKNKPHLYVSTFKSNYAQMKTDLANSHGKVFEDDGENVYIWNEVKDTLLRYKQFFIR